MQAVLPNPFGSFLTGYDTALQRDREAQRLLRDLRAADQDFNFRQANDPLRLRQTQQTIAANDAALDNQLLTNSFNRNTLQNRTSLVGQQLISAGLGNTAAAQRINFDTLNNPTRLQLGRLNALGAQLDNTQTQQQIAFDGQNNTTLLRQNVARLTGTVLGNQQTQQQLDFNAAANPIRVNRLNQGLVGDFLGNQQTQQQIVFDSQRNPILVNRAQAGLANDFIRNDAASLGLDLSRATFGSQISSAQGAAASALARGATDTAVFNANAANNTFANTVSRAEQIAQSNFVGRPIYTFGGQTGTNALVAGLREGIEGLSTTQRNQLVGGNLTLPGYTQSETRQILAAAGAPTSRRITLGGLFDRSAPIVSNSGVVDLGAIAPGLGFAQQGFQAQQPQAFNPFALESFGGR